MLAMLAAGCATTEVKNIVRSHQPVGKIETLTVKVESGFAPSKQGTRLKKTFSDELQKNGFKVEQTSDIFLEIEIENILLGSGSSSATVRS